MTEVRFSVGARNFSLHHCVQTDSGVYPDCCTKGTGGSFPGLKFPGASSSLFVSSQCLCQEWWKYISTPPYVFMAYCLIKSRKIFLYLGLNIYVNS
jgi:hypothetical protein